MIPMSTAKSSINALGLSPMTPLFCSMFPHYLLGGALLLRLSAVWAFIRQSDYDPNDFNPQYRKLPIISGLLVPFSILMEIPGLTDHWYVRTDPITNKPAEYQNNSAILQAGLAISMASAVIANVSLINRYLERHVRASTISAMAFLTVHDIINLVTIIIFGLRGRKNDGFTYAQAYWFTVASTIVSSITNVTLLIDFVRTKDFATSGSGLSHKQRSLVIIVILLFSWVAIGAGCFTALLDINFQDSLYFTIVSMETIGFGDINPGDKTGARIFIIIYFSTAIFNLGLAVTTIRDVVAEGIRHAARRRRRRAARHKLRRERQLAATAENPTFIYHGGGRRIVNTTADELHADAPTASVLGIILEALKFWAKKRFDGDDDDDDDDEIDVHAGHEMHTYEDERILPEDQHLFMPRVVDPELDAVYRAEVERHDRRDRIMQLTVAFFIFVSFWMVGGVIFMKTEGWGFGSSVYFCFITFTTIGYGDLYPKTPAGRAIFTFWALLGVGGLTVFISVLGEAYAGAFSNAVEAGTYSTQVYNRLQTRRNQARSEELAQRNAELLASNERLDQLATDLINHARTYHPHMRHVFGIDGLRHRSNEEPSKKLKELLLDELAGEDSRTQHIVLKHPEMRKTCFTVSYDRSFDRLMQTAIALARDPGPATNTSIADENTSPRRPQTSTARSPRAMQSMSPSQSQAQGLPQSRPPSPPTSNLLQRSVTFDLTDADIDLSTTDNYVDNHVV